ncbi:27704_t:CDS:2, partial [Dentiscutata erythropus]
EGKPRNVEIGYLQNIKQLETTEWHFIKLATEGLYCTSKSEYQINLSKTALKEDLESIRKGVKAVIGIIVGLLRDRITMCDEHENKKLRL